MKTPVVTRMRTQGARRRHDASRETTMSQIWAEKGTFEDLMRNREKMRKGIPSLFFNGI